MSATVRLRRSAGTRLDLGTITRSRPSGMKLQPRLIVSLKGTSVSLCRRYERKLSSLRELVA